MIPPEKPENEEQRLITLYQLNILDTDSESRYDRITRIACKLFDVPMAFITFMEYERQFIKSYQGYEIREAPRRTSFCGHAILSDNIMIVENASQDPRFHDNPFVLGDPYFRFYVGCPLKINSYNVGTFCLIDNKPREKEAIDQPGVFDLAHMVELELTSLHQSTTDELTDLFNLRGFSKVAGFLFTKCEQEKRVFNLLYFDLDKFKPINDRFGHAEGDRVLKIFAHALQDEFSEEDIVARLGGDEFCVFCQNSNPKEIEKIIERLKTFLATQARGDYEIAFSLGMIPYNPKQHSSLKEMMEGADTQMYKNKKDKG